MKTSQREDRTILNEVTEDTFIKGRWIDKIWDLTPIEQKSDTMYYKREDKFAPMGMNSINGSKCRQLLWLFDRERNVDTVVHATNLNSSPQTPMTAAMAEHYGYRNIQVAGGTTFESMNKKELPLAASIHGTEYDITVGSGFNVVIQKRVDEIMTHHPKSFKIERDITLDHHLEKNTPEVLREFHSVGGEQVKNIPDHIEDLIIPFGSSTSTCSVLYGLSSFKPKGLKRIHLINVGVDKRDYMFERLSYMGASVNEFEIIYKDTKLPYSKTIKDVSIDDITFHMRYEAKSYKYLLENLPELIKPTSLFWVIGSYPDTKTTAMNLNREVPTEVNLYEFKTNNIMEFM
jgi:hypothetical protein